MSILWADRTFVDDEWRTDEEDIEPEEVYLHTGRCSAFLAWSASLEKSHRVSQSNPGSLSRIIWKLGTTQGESESEWEDDYFLLVPPSAHLIEEIHAGVSNLHPPQGQHDSLIAPTWQAPEYPGPDILSAPAKSEPAATLVNWRELNKKQAAGMPSGILSEEGSHVVSGPRIQVFDISALEIEDA
jgi:hypothetical protein